MAGRIGVTSRTVSRLADGKKIIHAEHPKHNNINAFDQPGVEAGKVRAYALLGRAGYESQRAEIEALQGHRKARYEI